MYAISGATGNTGSVVARALLASGQKVRVLARSADRLRDLEAAGAEPFACDLADAEALARAFDGVRAAYVMLPPNMASPDPRAEQDRVSDAIAAALRQAAVPYAVALSSIGADKAAGNGPVAGVHVLEERLAAIPALNVLSLRPGYFMENTFSMIAPIQTFGMAPGPFLPDLKISMIATRDIGAFAAEALRKLDFTGHSPRELLGERDLTMTEVASIIGRAIGNPGLAYAKLPDGVIRGAMQQSGVSAKVADLILEMAAAMNSGQMKALEARSAANTTPTSFETFVAEEFLPRYKGRPAGA